jgi:hypothetical protein
MSTTPEEPEEHRTPQRSETRPFSESDDRLANIKRDLDAALWRITQLATELNVQQALQRHTEERLRLAQERLAFVEAQRMSPTQEPDKSREDLELRLKSLEATFRDAMQGYRHIVAESILQSRGLLTNARRVRYVANALICPAAVVFLFALFYGLRPITFSEASDVAQPEHILNQQSPPTDKSSPSATPSKAADK